MKRPYIIPYADYWYDPCDDFADEISDKAYELAEEAGEDADDNWFYWQEQAEKAIFSQDESFDY